MVMVEMIRTDRVHIHGDGKNEMDGLRTHTQSAAGSNTFAGVLEVVELDVEMVEQSTEHETCFKFLQDCICVCGQLQP